MNCLKNFIRSRKCNQKIKINDLPSDRASSVTIECLPNEIICEIVNFFDIRNRMKVRCLNRRWRELSLTGITDLIVGCDIPCYLDFELIYEYKLEFRSDDKQRKMLKLILKKCGPSLQSLVLCNFEKDKKRSQNWLPILDRIPELCPKITGFYINSSNDVLKKMQISLYQRLGPRLELTCLDNLDSYNVDYDHCQLAIDHFDPHRLRCLSLEINRQEHLDTIVQHFPHLSKLFLIISLDHQKPLKFDLLQKLTKLKAFEYNRISDLPDFCFVPFLTSSFVRNLAHLFVDTSLQHFSPAELSQFHNLTSLRSLTIKLVSSHILPIILNSLTQLEHLNVYVELSSNADKQLAQHLGSICRLKRLNKLIFSFKIFRSTKIAFFPEPMPSVTFLVMKLVESEAMYANNLHNVPVVTRTLSTLFPNLVHLTFIWAQVPFDHFINSIDELNRLRHLTVCGYFLEFKQLKVWCDERKIILRQIY